MDEHNSMYLYLEFCWNNKWIFLKVWPSSLANSDYPLLKYSDIVDCNPKKIKLIELDPFILYHKWIFFSLKILSGNRIETDNKIGNYEMVSVKTGQKNELLQ